MTSASMYREHILDLYKNPLNFGTLNNHTHKYESNNSSCGDRIIIQLIVENDMIKDIKFDGVGCAISMASASLLTEKIKNMDIKSIKKLKKDDIVEMMHIPISPIRLKCALLSLDAVIGALEK